MIRKTLFFPLVYSGSPDSYLLQGNLAITPAIEKPSRAAAWEWPVKLPKAAQGHPGKTKDSSELVHPLSYTGTLSFYPYTALFQVFIAAIKHHDQKQLGEEWFIPSYTLTVLPKGKAGTEPEAEGKRCFPWLTQFTFSHTRQNQPPALWRHHSHWAGPCHINHYKWKLPRSCL